MLTLHPFAFSLHYHMLTIHLHFPLRPPPTFSFLNIPFLTLFYLTCTLSRTCFSLSLHSICTYPDPDSSLHTYLRCRIVDVDMKNARESMIADAAAAREESRAPVTAVDPYAYGAPSSPERRLKVRQQWNDFTTINLQKESVCRRRRLTSTAG
jgi:hypothetical protein